ncbi:MAG: BMC domain-containing protein [Desulfuromusa sp.]|nr:BMC domain-containing protein [Desulfuromusa sp.]
MKDKALGSFETIGFIPALTGADAALKSAGVKLLGCRYVGSGLVSVLLSGDVSSVKVAVESGCSAAVQVGTVTSQSVIARTADGLDGVIDDRLKGQKNSPKRARIAKLKSAPRSSKKGASEKNIELNSQSLTSMSVVKLRELARQFPGIPLDRRKIRSARKDELIDAISNEYQKNKE